MKISTKIEDENHSEDDVSNDILIDVNDDNDEGRRVRTMELPRQHLLLRTRQP